MVPLNEATITLLSSTSAFGPCIQRFNLTHIFFLILTNLDIYPIITNPLVSASSGNLNHIAMKHNKSKSWLLHRHVSINWLLSGHVFAQYVLCGHMSAQYALSGQLCWFPCSLVSWYQRLCQPDILSQLSNLARGV